MSFDLNFPSFSQDLFLGDDFLINGDDGQDTHQDWNTFNVPSDQLLFGETSEQINDFNDEKMAENQVPEDFFDELETDPVTNTLESLTKRIYQSHELTPEQIYKIKNEQKKTLLEFPYDPQHIALNLNLTSTQLKNLFAVTAENENQYYSLSVTYGHSRKSNAARACGIFLLHGLLLEKNWEWMRNEFPQTLLEYLKVLRKKQERSNAKETKDIFFPHFFNAPFKGTIDRDRAVNEEKRIGHDFSFEVTVLDLIFLFCEITGIDLAIINKIFEKQKLFIAQEGDKYVVKMFEANSSPAQNIKTPSKISVSPYRRLKKAKSTTKKHRILLKRPLITQVIETWYEDPILRAHLVKQVLESKGVFTLDLDAFDDSPYAIKKFIALDHSHYFTSMLCKFFRITTKVQPDEAKLRKLINSNTLTPEIKWQIFKLRAAADTQQNAFRIREEYQLPESLLIEATASFFDLKWSEFKDFSKTPLFPNKIIPFFLLSQDGNKAVVYPLRSAFDREGRLAALIKDTDHSALNKLKEVLGEIDETQSPIPLTLFQLEQLTAHISSQVGSEALEYIVDERRPYNVSLNLEDEIEAEEQMTEKAETTRERTIEKVEVQELNLDLEEFGVKRKREENPSLIIPPPLKKQRTEPGRNPGVLHRKEFELGNQYNPLHDPREALPEFQTSGCLNGQLPIIPATSTVVAEPVKPLANANFFLSISYSALKKVGINAHRENEKSKALIEVVPLSYPILEKWKIAETILPSCFNPLLKEYQKQEVEKILHMRRLKLHPVTALEMGLGKTFIYGEIIAQRLAVKGNKGIHLVVVPKALLYQVHQSLLKSFKESIAYSWRTLAIYQRGFEGYFLDNLLIKKEQLEWFPALGSFSPEKILEEALELRSNGRVGDQDIKEILNKISPLVKTHINDLFNHYDEIEIATALSQIMQNHNEQFCKYDLHWLNQIRGLEPDQLQSQINDLLDPKILFAKWNTLNGRFEALLSLAILTAKVLSYHPGRANERLLSNFNKEFIYNIATFPLENIIQLSKKEDLEKGINESKSTNGAQIAVVNYETFKTLDLEFLRSTNIHTLCFDEAQRVHNEETGCHKFFKDFLDKLKTTQGELPLISLVTGTPFENNFKELWNLLSISNPGGVPDATLNALTTLFDETLKKVIDASIITPNMESLKASLLHSYSHFFAFKFGIVRMLVNRLKMTDPQVRKDWNDKIPDRVDKTIDIVLQEDIKQKINSFTGQRLFHRNPRSMKLLMHPSLENAKNYEPSDEVVKDFIKNIASGTIPIEQSIFLSSLLKCKGFTRSLQKNQSSIILVDRITDGDAILAALSRSNQADAKFYNGKHKEEETIAWFKNANGEPRAKVLVLSLTAGGVGLDLPMAVKVFVMTRVFNPFQEEQGIARAVRVGHPGKRKIYRFNYGLFFQEHLFSTQAVKKAWEQFLFNENHLSNLFISWCKVLEESSYRQHLNDKKNVDSAREFKVKTHAILEQAMNDITPDDLVTICKKSMPESLMKTFMETFCPDEMVIEEEKPLIVLVKASIPQTFKTHDTFLVPKATSLDQALLIAYAFKKDFHQKNPIDLMWLKLRESNTSHPDVNAGIEFLEQKAREKDLKDILQECEIQVYAQKNGILEMVQQGGKSKSSFRLRLVQMGNSTYSVLGFKN